MNLILIWCMMWVDENDGNMNKIFHCHFFTLWLSMSPSYTSKASFSSVRVRSRWSDPSWLISSIIFRISFFSFFIRSCSAGSIAEENIQWPFIHSRTFYNRYVRFGHKLGQIGPQFGSKCDSSAVLKILNYKTYDISNSNKIFQQLYHV